MTMSYYIGSQIDTIKLQSEYNAKLIDATYDSMNAFQINTVNNRYSSVANSKIRDIEAAASAFYTSLSDSEEIAKQDLREYVPALVFTLYDGYYIYSKYENVYGGNTAIGRPELDSTTLKGEEYENEGLKPYIYYSCRFQKGQKDFVVNFTLDNAITIYGDIGEGYKTYSGYLINPNSVTNLNYNENGSPLSWSLTYDKVNIGYELLTEHLLFEDSSQNDYDYLVYNGQKIYYDTGVASGGNKTPYFYYQNYSKEYITRTEANSTLIEYLQNRTRNNHLYSTSSFEYYQKAQDFSRKIGSLIGNITQADAINQEGNPMQFSVNTGTDKIFLANSNNDPLLSGSTFNEIRMQVIRKSIETNLTTAIAQYSMFNNSFYEFRLPVLTEEDWSKVTNQVSLISFLQGISIGHKYYNNYCVITNDKNEEIVNEENIYIITKNSQRQREYHLPGCKELAKPQTETGLQIVDVAYSNLSFLRQTVRISEGNYLYFYPQTRNNQTITSCYHCMVNATDVYPADQIIEGKTIEKDNNWNDVVKADATKSGSVDKRLKEIREYYIRALGRERYDLYSTNIGRFSM